MKDWAFTTSVEEMEAATNALLETANKVGADTWQKRVKDQTPHCGFGEAGTCCRICSMGPCRITKKAPGASVAAMFMASLPVTICVSP